MVDVGSSSTAWVSPDICGSHQELRNDRDVVMRAVGKDSRALEFASTFLRGDREVRIAVGKEAGLLEASKPRKNQSRRKIGQNYHHGQNCYKDDLRK